ncbi:uncharacterized protein EV422DRAFT_300811 [Fimicolochytrium jonesii]|uniref:uncharacterized protein n=1 Tax=Fimicolochytrium jonesii TaxID=1396493 RepID=UPI0022FE7780|nr:uncharacterized protein EV422DRAFT_300811 [Fimicolochytrium jonesii]KAI8823954.1 hypothetical protein EV422DRAFT_300811 [Fimicolochytrium jonesii]
MSRYVPAHNNRPGAGQRAGTGQQLYPPRPSAPQPHYNNFNNPNPNATHIPPSITNANATYMAIEMQASQMFSQLDVDGPNLGASLIGDALMDDKNVGMGMGMNVDDAALRFAAGDSGRTQSQFQIPHARPADESARLLQQTLEENKNLKAENERILREKNAKEGEVSNVRRSLAQANAENSNLRADLQRTANKAEKDLEEVKKNAERELEKWKTENGFLQNDVAEFKVALAAQRPQRMKHVTQATNDTFSKNRQWPDEKTTGPTSPAPIPIRVQKQDAATETAPESPKKCMVLCSYQHISAKFLRQCMFASLPVGRDIFLTPTSLTALLPPYLSQCNSLNKMQTDGPHTTLIRDMRRLLVDASLDVAVLLPSVEGMVGGCLVELKYEPLVFLVHLLSTMCDHSAACREQITDLDSSESPKNGPPLGTSRPTRRAAYM